MEPSFVMVAKEEKIVKSAREVMVTVFWDTERLLRVEFLDYGININSKYYVSLLKRLWARNIQKRHAKMSKGVRLLGYARAYHRSATINKLVDCGSEMIPHLPFFTDLALSDFNLFTNMKKHSRVASLWITKR